MVDRGDEARAEEVGLLVGRLVAAPEPQQHRRERLTPDRLVERDAADEDALVGRRGDRRRPRGGLVGLSRPGALVRAGRRSVAHCATW